MNRFLLLLLLLLIPSRILSASSFFVHNDFRMKAGDDPRWARSDWLDQDWTPVFLYEVPQPKEIVWLRTSVDLLPDHFTSGHPFGLHFAALASHEIYWDGVLIGEGGRPGRTSAEEIPGPLQTLYVVPDRLATVGHHVIAIRSSAHHRHFHPHTGYWVMILGDYNKLIYLEQRTTLLSLVSLSGMVVVSVFAFLLFWIDRSDRSYLLLALIGIVGALLLIAEAWRNLFGYTYNWHILRLAIIVGLTALLNLLLLLFTILRFPAKHYKIFLALALAGFSLAMTARGWDEKSLFLFLTGIVLSFLWTLRAAFQRRQGSWLALTGLGTTGIVFFSWPYLFADLTVYFGINFLLVCLLIAHVLQVRQVRVEREEALLKSARLEIELLKKYIQPHYLMNTLTALSEWIEQKPKEASEMVQALGEEFRLLSSVSHCSLISLEDEIRLCASHLEIMGRRKARSFVFDTNGIHPGSLVPPAVIHTLVENAVIHNKHVNQEVIFSLKQQRQNGFVQYIFTAPLGATHFHGTKEGTGFRYIKARLRENYGDHWKFESGREGDLWKSEIWIPDESG